MKTSHTTAKKSARTISDEKMSTDDGNVPHYDLFLSASDSTQLQKTLSNIIVTKIKPEWQESSLKFEFFTQGLTNAIISCWQDVDACDRVLVRIYGEKTDLIIDRKLEKDCMKILSDRGYAAPIYCTFVNGLAYGFVPGVVLNVETVREKKIASLVARRLAEIHTIEQDDSWTKINTKPTLWVTIDRFLKSFPFSFDDEHVQKKFHEHFLSFSELQKEYELLKDRVMQLQCPIVFCHNDLLLNNLIYDDKKDCVTFIDFEYGGYNYQAYDIADHFTEYAGTDNVDFTLYPDKTYQVWWLENYLKMYNHLKGYDPPNELHIETLYDQVNIMATAAHFLWAVWAIVQAKNSLIDFDYLQYGIDRMHEYFRMKRNFW